MMPKKGTCEEIHLKERLKSGFKSFTGVIIDWELMCPSSSQPPKSSCQPPPRPRGELLAVPLQSVKGGTRAGTRMELCGREF